MNTETITRWVRLSRYCAATDDTPDAVHARRRRGQWIDGIHCKIGPDGKLWVNPSEVNKWVAAGGDSIPVDTPQQRAADHGHFESIIALVVAAHELRPAPGVYWLIDHTDKVIYVGQSQDCITRMGAHGSKPFSRAKMVTIEDEGERNSVERTLIRFLAPEMNVMHNPKLRVV